VSFTEGNIEESTGKHQQNLRCHLYIKKEVRSVPLGDEEGKFGAEEGLRVIRSKAKDHGSFLRSEKNQRTSQKTRKGGINAGGAQLTEKNQNCLGHNIHKFLKRRKKVCEQKGTQMTKGKLLSIMKKTNGII